MQIIQKTTVWLRRAMLDAAENVSLFFVAAFVIPHVMCGFPLEGMAELANMLEMYLVFPWGAALCLLTLSRRAEDRLSKPRMDFCVMFLLLAWITVPFIFRFGLTRGNLSAANGYMILFFGLYASIVTADAQRRGKLLDLAAALFAVFSYFFAGALLTAAWGHTIILYQYGVFPFGVHKYGGLCAGIHYNGTALIAICGALMCLIGFVRRKNLLAKIAHLIPALMMILVVILTQSRTSRYALIVAFAAALYGYIASGNWNKHALVRHTAGILAGVVMLAGGYVGAVKITEAALYRYAVVDMQRKIEKEQAAAKVAAEAPTQAPTATPKPAAEAQTAEVPAATPKSEPTAAPEATATPEIKPSRPRSMGEATFTGRTKIWEAAFKVWKNNPFHFLIGQGHGRSEKEIGKYCPLGEIDAHNAYIQVILDFGLIGFVLLMALLGMAVPHAWRIFFARPERAIPGGRLLCALIIAGLVSGLMEIEIFHIMRYTNLAFFYALAMLVAFGRDMVE